MTATLTASASLTPTLRQGARRTVFWVAIGLVLLLAGLGSLLAIGSAADTVRLSPGSAAPTGVKAVAQVLGRQGVTVTAVDTFADATRAAADPATTTLVLVDPDNTLTPARLRLLPALASHIVLLEPGFRQLRALAPGVNAAGTPDDDALVAACTLRAATAADTVSPGGFAYRVSEGTTAQRCLRSSRPGSADAYSLVQLTTGQTTVSVVGATDALTNGTVAERGNAAFALTLLGDHEHLVWYHPSAADVAGGVAPSTLTPRWLTPAIVLSTLVVLLAAVWRGRRFGALVIEDLPVTVRSSETMEGRARLYQRGSARLRAIDTLRVAAVSRIAVSSGLPRTATVDEVVLAAAEITGTDLRVVRATLLDDVPLTDRAFVALGGRLRALEAAVAEAARP